MECKDIHRICESEELGTTVNYMYEIYKGIKDFKRA